MIVNRRVYRTADGRLVEHDDPEAAFLAFPAGEDVPDAEARRSGLAAFLRHASNGDSAGSKRASRPADKAVHAPAGDKGGLTTTRASTKENSDG